MGVWFSASAVVPALREAWELSDGDVSWLTTAVQLGFVAGAVLSAVLNVADRFSGRAVIAVCGAGAALTTVAFAAFADGLATGVPLRFLTGMALAGVYPPGLRLLSSWFGVGAGWRSASLSARSPWARRARTRSPPCRRCPGGR